VRILKNILINCCILFQQTSSYASTQKQSNELSSKHTTARYLECDEDLMNDHFSLEEAFRLAIKESGANVLSLSCHFFESKGLSLVAILEDGELSINTYPESLACFIDLFSGHQCFDWKKFDAVLKEYLNPNLANTEVVIED